MKVEEIVKYMAESVPPSKVSVTEKVFAFIVRDFKIWWTYKLWITLDVISSLTFVATYYFVSMITTPQALVESGYAADFLTFSIIGISFQHYVFSSVSSLSDAIREEQWNGTMETILSSTTSFRVFLLGESMFRFIIGSYFLAASLGMGTLLGMRFILNIESMLATLVLTILLVISHMVIGILGAAMILKLKQGDPIVWAFSWLTQLFSGVLYPLGLLPDWLKWVGNVFPLTYSLDGLRRCLMNGESLSSPMIIENVVKLIVFIVVVLPFSLWFFKKSYDSTRREGALGQY
ncbi:MAG: ABC transporter permease [Thermoproteota archaeon]